MTASARQHCGGRNGHHLAEALVGRPLQPATALPGTTPAPTTPVGTSEATTAPAQAALTVAACDLLAIDEVEATIGLLTPGPVYDDSVSQFFECGYDGADDNMMVDVTVFKNAARA